MMLPPLAARMVFKFMPGSDHSTTRMLGLTPAVAPAARHLVRQA
jgi:hypothetical protein